MSQVEEMFKERKKSEIQSPSIVGQAQVIDTGVGEDGSDAEALVEIPDLDGAIITARDDLGGVVAELGGINLVDMASQGVLFMIVVVFNI